MNRDHTVFHDVDHIFIFCLIHIILEGKIVIVYHNLNEYNNVLLIKKMALHTALLIYIQ